MTTPTVSYAAAGGGKPPELDRRTLVRMIIAAVLGAASVLGISEAVEDSPVQVVCPPPARVGVTVDAGTR